MKSLQNLLFALPSSAKIWSKNDMLRIYFADKTFIDWSCNVNQYKTAIALFESDEWENEYETYDDMIKAEMKYMLDKFNWLPVKKYIIANQNKTILKTLKNQAGEKNIVEYMREFSTYSMILFSDNEILEIMSKL